MLRIGGLASGMDTQQLIQDMMRVQRIPLDRLFQKKEWLDWQQDAYRDVNLKVSKFRDDFGKLRLQSTFLAYKADVSTGSGSSPGFSANPTANAIFGTYEVDVQAVAKPAQLISKKIELDVDDPRAGEVGFKNIFDFVGRTNSQEFELNIVLNGDSAKTATITVDAADTFASLAHKISIATYEQDGKEVSAGLRAIFDNTTGTMMITSKELGSDISFKFEEPPSEAEPGAIELWNNLFAITDGDGNIIGHKHDAQGTNASIKFNGVEINDLKSNQVTVYGIQLNLLQETGGPQTLTISSNPDQVMDTIKEFVDSYNQLVEELQGKLQESRYRDYQPLTNEEREAISEREAELWDERAKSGLLRNDPIVRSLLQELRSALMTPVSGIPSDQIRSLAQIGITTTRDYLKGGILEIDEDKLREAIEQKPDEVMRLFTNSPSEDDDTAEMGLGRRVYSIVNSSISSLRDKAGSPGNSADTQSSIAKNIRQVNDQMYNWERRLQQIEDRYWKQFTAMERAMDQMNQQSMFLMQNLFGGMMGNQ